MTDPPLLIYQQTCAATLTDPRPGPRHALRAFPRPDLRRMAMAAQDERQDDLTADDHLVENTDKGDDGADIEFAALDQDPRHAPVSVVDENGFPA